MKTDFHGSVEYQTSFHSKKTKAKGRVRSLSENGISIILDTHDILAGTAQIEMAPHGFQQTIKVDCKVCWMRAMPDGKHFNYGLQILDPVPSALKAIQRFIAQGKDKNERAIVVRQDRIDISKRHCGIMVNGQIYKVANYNPFGIAVVHPVQEIMENHFPYAAFFVEGMEACTLNLKKVRAEIFSDGNNLTIFEIIGEPIRLEHITAMLLSHDIVKRQKKYLETKNDVPEDFRTKVYEIKEWLEHLEQEVNALQNNMPKTGLQDLQTFENGVCKVISDFLNKSLPPICDACFLALSNITPLQFKASLNFFREKLIGLLYQSPFSHRSYNKPLGYAGDYEIMNLIYRDQEEGDTLFAKCLHRYYINQPAAKAVRNRINYLLPKIYETLDELCVNGQKLKMLSVASGPAVELQSLLQDKKIEEPMDLEIHLMDQDLASLKYAQRKLRTLSMKLQSKITLRYIHQPIKTLIARGLKDSNYDLIYALGVFDYLSDSVAFATAKKLYESLKPGGKIIIGNFDIKNPTRTTMELVLDWNLIYRSNEDLIRLFSPLSREMRIDREEEGVNLFCIIQKPATI